MKLIISKIHKNNYHIFRERHDYGPFPAAYYYLDWVNSRCEKYFGAKISRALQPCLGAYQTGKGLAIVETAKQWKHLTRKILNRILHNKTFVRKTRQKGNLIGRRFKRFSYVLLKKKSIFASMDELKDFHSKWIWQYKEFSFYNCLIWLACADELASHVSRILEKKYKLSTKDIQLLTTPVIPTYASREEGELLRIGMKINFKKPNLNAQSLVTQRLFKTHAEKWAFILWDYIGPKFLNANICFQRLLKIGTTKQSILNSLLAQRNYYNKLKKIQQTLVRKHLISKEIKRVIEDLKILTCMQDEKKEVCTLAQFALHKTIFAYAAKRTGLPPVACIKFSEKELWEMMENNKIAIKKTLAKRLISITSITSSRGVEILCGQKSKIFFNKFMDKVPALGVLQGQVACIGIARGKVRILQSSKDIYKVRKNDILIATMTTPDYVPAMRLAGAIVTNEGGLTSHAAIMSRELGIPCVVGTKIATKVFKDGDMVEVDAERGIVKKIK